MLVVLSFLKSELQILDGDNDLDIFGVVNNTLCWFEHLDGYGNFGNFQYISVTESIPYTATIYAIDLDGDEDPDILYENDFKVAWYENIEGQSFSFFSSIISSDLEDVTTCLPLRY